MSTITPQRFTALNAVTRRDRDFPQAWSHAWCAYHAPFFVSWLPKTGENTAPSPHAKMWHVFTRHTLAAVSFPLSKEDAEKLVEAAHMKAAEHIMLQEVRS